jgi:MFS family permease
MITVSKRFGRLEQGSSQDAETGRAAAALPRAPDLPDHLLSRADRKLILAASAGTAFEWYDFFLYGSLASVLGKHFFAGVNDTTAFLFALLTFAVGFVVRPIGALIFGRFGDRLGRKRTFLFTILMMGLATALVGVLPTYAAIGVWAPMLLVALRTLQGLAIGGEYGGAATYVAEHVPAGRRGYATGWIQTTAACGLVLSLLVILVCQHFLGQVAFEAWGWRIPFLLSVVLLGISVYIRLQLTESPVFSELRRSGRLSRAPIAESLGEWRNLRILLLAIFGAVAGQAVVGYCAQIYALFFITQTLRLETAGANLLVLASLVLGAPLFVLFGWLSDRVGRKPIVMAGCLIAILTLFPIFHGLTRFVNPAIAAAQQAQPVVVAADPRSCSFQFDPLGRKRFASGCDLAKAALAKAGVPYTNLAAAAGSIAKMRIGTATVDVPGAEHLSDLELSRHRAQFSALLATRLARAGYPTTADAGRVNYPAALALLMLLVVYMTMVYGPLAAWLVELFPAHLRYTSLSTAYHVGNGWLGGFLPTVAFALVAFTGNIYSGLWYPVVIAAMTLIVGTWALPETHAPAAQ